MPTLLELQQKLDNTVGKLNADVQEIRQLLKEMNHITGAMPGNGDILSCSDPRRNLLQYAQAALIAPHRFGKPVVFAIREYLESIGRSATLDELREALEAGNCTMGKYPKRTVKLAVVNNRDFLTLDRQTKVVSLIEPKSL
jgi:hypothetical protein